MTDDQIRIAIAESCGWRLVEGYYKDGSVAGKSWVRPDGIGMPLPDYPNDLNAMHEAEAALKPELFTIYDDRLGAAVYGDCGLILPSTGDPYKKLNRWKFHATARQRAEAYLKTIGKWIEP